MAVAVLSRWPCIPAEGARSADRRGGGPVVARIDFSLSYNFRNPESFEGLPADAMRQPGARRRWDLSSLVVGHADEIVRTIEEKLEEAPYTHLVWGGGNTTPSGYPPRRCTRTCSVSPAK